jgi:RNA polymerase sigma-70 factor (ECF subfamily)
VYRRYRVPVFRFLFRVSGDRQLTDDLFQNTWLKLARAAPRLRSDTNLQAWLFSVARNEYRSHRRWHRMDVRRLLAAEAEVAIVQGEGAEQQHHSLRTAERALARVSSSDRELLLLVGVEGVELHSVAEILGVSYPAVRQRLVRARVQLAALIEELER